MPSSDFDQQSAIGKLTSVMAMLRDGEFGCPWDLEQSIRSLVPHTLEEVYEVVDAIEREDMIELEDELGDLLFQVVFYAQLAAEQGAFSFDDVAAAITRKLIRRHPHVFPDGDVSRFGRKPDITSAQVVVNWEAIKQQEREEKRARRGGGVETEAAESVLDAVPRALPALNRAGKLQSRAARHGFDWQDIAPVIDKLKEEIAEFESAVAAGDNAGAESELGDILFATVNLARHSGVEPEVALRGANQRFETRFRWIEAALSGRGRTLGEATLDELDQLWEQAKAAGL